jgi:hypothetical protein
VRAAIERDTTAREITIKIMDGPLLDVTRSWQAQPRVIQVNRVIIRVVDHETRNIRAFGALIKKNGQPGQQRGEAEWRSSAYTDRDRIDTAPQWVQKLWREAPAGVTSWREEVHA